MLYTFFDTETSGLESDCDILSFSYMLADENLDVKKAETLYYWREGVTKWTQEAYAVNHLSKEFLRQYEEQYEKNVTKMYILLCYASLVGYNSGWLGGDGLIHGFDFDRCKSFLVRNGMPEPRPAEFIDVMKLCERMLHRKYKLSVAFNKCGLSEEIASAINQVYFGDRNGVAHESSFDTVMTAMLFQRLHEEGEVKEGAGGVTWAVDLEKQEVSTEWMLFFDKEELKAMSVVTNDEGTDVKVYTMSELVDKDMRIFEYLMKNPEQHTCLDKELLNTVLGGNSEGGFIDV